MRITFKTILTGIWISSNKVVKPELSRQYSLGYFENFNNNPIETSAELYYKILLFEAAEKPELKLGKDKVSFLPAVGDKSFARTLTFNKILL